MRSAVIGAGNIGTLHAHILSECGYLAAVCDIDESKLSPYVGLALYTDYKKLIDDAAAAIDFSRLTDISVGAFRISADYLTRMRQAYPDSEIAWYPYMVRDSVAQYDPETDKSMQDYVCGLLTEHIEREKIFTWN